MDKNELKEVKEVASNSAKLAKNAASGNVLGAAKNAINLLKSEKFRKMLKKQLILIAIKSIIPIIIIIFVAGSVLSIFNTIKDKMGELIGRIGNFSTSLWTKITNDYWIDIDEKVLYEKEDGTKEELTLADVYMEELTDLGISIEDLRLLGEVDYNDEEVLASEENRKLLQKYLWEFIRADMISQEINRRGKKTLVKKTDDTKVDGGIYLYRTKNEVDEEGVVRLDSATTMKMEYLDMDEFLSYQTKDPLEIDYEKAKKIFTVDRATRELFYYKVDEIQEVQQSNEHTTDKELQEPKVILTLQKEKYLDYVRKYTMPFEFLVSLCLITQNPEFVYHVAYLARKTNIELVILDNIQEESYIEEVIGHYKKYDASGEVIDDNPDYLVSKKQYYYKTDTPTIKIQKVNTWSYAMLYKYTNKIIGNEEMQGNYEGTDDGDEDYNVVEEALEDVKYSTGTPDSQGNVKYVTTTTITDQVKTIKTLNRSNEYTQEILVDETKKSKQFLGLLRNKEGKCYEDDCFEEKDLVKNCVKKAEFDKDGKNVSYKLPNTTEREMPLNKLQSGEQMLYALLETTSTDPEMSGYNSKMQGLKEYMQYIMTFPENEWIDLDDEDFDELLEDADYDDNVTYGMFWWPLDENAEVRVSSYFGKRRAPTPTASTDHGAIDIAVAEGTDVLAAADGVVEYVGNDPDGYGNYITIDHQNGYKTRYAHNSEILVKKGDSVKKGQVIAKSGSTGNSTGPHLHFEVLLNGTKVDPLDYVNMTNKQPTGKTYDEGNATQLEVIYAVVARRM